MSKKRGYLTIFSPCDLWPFRHRLSSYKRVFPYILSIWPLWPLIIINHQSLYYKEHCIKSSLSWLPAVSHHWMTFQFSRRFFLKTFDAKHQPENYVMSVLSQHRSKLYSITIIQPCIERSSLVKWKSCLLRQATS